MANTCTMEDSMTTNYERAQSDDSNSQRIQRPPGEPQNSDSVTSLRSAISNRGWEIPSSHARTFNRRNLQPITGTDAAGSVKGSFRNATDMFVSRVQRLTSDNDMMEFMQNKGVNLLDFLRMSHPDSKFKSFKLTFSVTDYMFLYDSSQWPHGVDIRLEKYRNGPNKFRNNNYRHG